MKQENVISDFSGKYDFLSNFSKSKIKYEGITYPTVEHAFQAAKSLNNLKRLEIASAPTPGQAKRIGRRVNLRPDWEEVKINVMRDCLRLKFEIPELRKALLNTNNAELIEGNWWGDKFWGMCNGVGENNLGKLLMEVRDEIRRNKY